MSVFHCVICEKLPPAPVNDDWRIGPERRATCFGETICRDCDASFTRNPIKSPKSETEKAHDRDYRKFLAGKLYPEIVCEHIAASDGAVARARLKSRSKFYQQV